MTTDGKNAPDLLGPLADSWVLFKEKVLVDDDGAPTHFSEVDLDNLNVAFMCGAMAVTDCISMLGEEGLGDAVLRSLAAIMAEVEDFRTMTLERVKEAEAEQMVGLSNG